MARALALLLLLCATPATAAVGGTIAADAVWEGVVAAEGPVTVGPAATLTIRPGTEIRFPAGSGLTVNGVLLAEGNAERPIRFLPAAEGQPRWSGIVVFAGRSPSLLRSCVVVGAEAVTFAGGAHRVEACEIAGGIVGVSVTGNGTHPVITGSRVLDMAEDGIRCTANASVTVLDSVVERAGQRGIAALSGGEALVRGCRISRCETGIDLAQSAPRLSGNTVSGCGRGIVLTSLGGGEPVRGNTVEENETGILCQHFADPEIAGNVVRRNREGIVCFMGARPLIRANEIRENDTGLLCNQLSTPEVTGNVIAGNRRGVYLHLSSYAILRANDIMGNAVAAELGNMSLDWERRVGNKPMRGLFQRNQGRAERGVAVPEQPKHDGLEIRGGAVDAAGNWWGEEITREMAAKGPDANIAAIVDGYDVPVRTYEGFEGEYAQDRITYAPWAAGPVAGAAAGASPAPAPAERSTAQ